ncbi:MAG: FAD-linked oxidase [Desulfatitalea sp. BRH_c12]|nr:MAG: FAD-linked oxidase [Desulfatitalea sp. BRH_c12]
MSRTTAREIPYNYTSADDRRILGLLLGDEVLAPLEQLVFTRRTGRSWRLLMRFIGDLFIHRRNPFLYQELVDHRDRRNRFMTAARKDLDLIAARSCQEPDLALVLGKCGQALDALGTELAGVVAARSRIREHLGAISGEQNVFFDPFTLAAHATDATDWRLHLPVAVVCPDQEVQVPLLLQAIAALGLKAIPRGGGTGLTGGAVPVAPGCVMINTEKLNRIGAIQKAVFKHADGTPLNLSTIELEAGVITEAAMQAAAAAGLVFATDPTSAWACTIGGNIAENAGGKRAVLWGTAIDNLLGFRIAVADGRLLAVTRLHPTGQRIDPQETIVFGVSDAATGELLKHIQIHGLQLRKPGLGKDITNKTLEGLPGVQKEGTDGIITAAVFMLHHAYPHQRTVCLEFFGEDMEEAAQVIDRISQAFAQRGREALSALEHFDEEYVRAIQYKAKAPRSQRPKAVLLIDIVGHAAAQVDSGLARLTALLADYPNTFMAVAQNTQEAERFWRDRKRLGAIAARTNAFKLNEDIVLPLKALAEFAAFVDHLNVEEERGNQEEVIWQLLTYLEKAVPIEDPEWLTAKLPRARQLLTQTLEHIQLAGRTHLRAETHLHAIEESMLELLRGYSKVTAEIQRDIAEIRARRIVVATHMHAGDGNVHVNIPVFSNDREMMLRAAEVADLIMEKTVELEGVVSGEHGIGFTKIKHLDADILAAFKSYLQSVDPHDLINPGKLTDRRVAERVYTPSFNLIELEARILRYGHLEQLAEKISKCVRCGRCKTTCCVFYPSGNLFYHPRNKNLALTGIIEALLYDAQRSHVIGLRPLRWLGEIADHCTLCHKCQAPCPVDIDTAEVSILEREVLNVHGAGRTAWPTRMVLGYLSSRSQWTNSVVRRLLLQGGGALQRAGARVIGRQWRRSAILAPLYAPAPPIAGRPLEAMLPRRHDFDHALLLSPQEVPTATVFYFPGCGSERLHADVALAVIFLLLHTGVRVVLPPKYLCCGFPARANAKIDLNGRQELRNTIIFNQIRSMLGHIEFDGCVVSCGTCREGLVRTNAAAIFAAPLSDVSDFVLARGLDVQLAGACLYHQPCHDSLDGRGEALLRKIAPAGVATVPQCCSEAGTLALSRPDIAAAMLDRKRSELALALAAQPRDLLLTNCPACLNGLGRQRGIHPQHLAVALAEACAPGNWRKTVVQQVARAELVRI